MMQSYGSLSSLKNPITVRPYAESRQEKRKSTGLIDFNFFEILRAKVDFSKTSKTAFPSKLAGF